MALTHLTGSGADGWGGGGGGVGVATKLNIRPTEAILFRMHA